MKKYKGLLAVLALAAGSALQAQTNELVIQAGKPGAEIQPTMYGLFFEDINYAADGGLYAELVKNRSFEFPQHFMGWKTFGKVSLKDDGLFERNPHYVRLAYAGHPHKQTGLDNEGFFGIGIKKGAEYRFSVWARVAEGETPAKIRVELADTKSMNEQQAFATADVTVDSKEWKKYQVILKPEVTNPKAILRIFLASRQTVDLEHISLFPVDTWQGHENGLRKDLVQALADIEPGVFRFPGGCIVEGTDIASRYDWKKSVGMVENRPLNENRWQYTFPHRFFPDYYQSYGLGFYEFFQLSEEIGAEPLPVLSCGLACQFQNPNMDAHVSLCDLESYIQDALDLIEFANGAVDTPWGKIRADMGHPAPFNLKLIGIGNEQWGKEYPEHLEPFVPSRACSIAPIAAARCMSTAPTTASAFLNTPAHSTPKFLVGHSARPSTVSMKMWYCLLFPKCSKPLPSMRSMTEPSLSVWCRKRSPASRPQRSGNSGHALPPQSREFPNWKSCSAKSTRTTF